MVLDTGLVSYRWSENLAGLWVEYYTSMQKTLGLHPNRGKEILNTFAFLDSVVHLASK